MSSLVRPSQVPSASPSLFFRVSEHANVRTALTTFNDMDGEADPLVPAGALTRSAIAAVPRSRLQGQGLQVGAAAATLSRR